MTYVVTSRCVDCRYMSCVVVCPKDCFVEVLDPAMLVIDPAECIDCDACVSECPVNAIWPDHELPDAYADWLGKNAELAKVGTPVNEAGDPLDSARLLDEIQDEERAKGLEIEEPSSAGH